MVKTMAISFLFLSAIAYAATNITRWTKIGPSTSASNITIGAPGAGFYNCISELDVISDAAFSLNVLVGGTTAYSVDLSSASGLVRSWDDPSAICASANTAMYINVSAGNFKINYSGFTYK